MQAKQMAQANGWKVIQMAAKFRNPKHQLDAEGRQVYTLLEANPTLMGVWMRTHIDDQTGTRYFVGSPWSLRALPVTVPRTNGRPSLNTRIPRTLRMIFRRVISGASIPCSSPMRREGRQLVLRPVVGGGLGRRAAKKCLHC
jgi:hypothetical protein